MPKYLIKATAKGSKRDFNKEFQAESGTGAIRLGLQMFSKAIAVEFKKTDKPLQFSLVIQEKQS